jgi:hypothetical protein
MRLDVEMLFLSIVIAAVDRHCQRRADPRASKRDDFLEKLSANTFRSAALSLRSFECLTE